MNSYKILLTYNTLKIIQEGYCLNINYLEITCLTQFYKSTKNKIIIIDITVQTKNICMNILKCGLMLNDLKMS